MSTIRTHPTHSALDSRTGIDSGLLWRVGGGLALAHVVLMFVGLTQEPITEHGTPINDLARTLGGASLTRTYAGGYIESMAFLVLVPAVVIIARLLGRRTEVSRLAATSFLALGTAYVASTLAVGFPPGAAAAYGLQHGGDAHAASMLLDVRNFGFFLQVALSCAMALEIGIAALSERVHVRWVGYGGVTLGAVGLVATPFAHNVISMAWLVWWVGLAVLFLRGVAEPRETAGNAHPDAAS